MLKPPQKFEILPGCKTLLDNSSLAADLSINGQVAAVEGNVLEVDEPSSIPWWRVVLMPVINGLAAPTEYPDKVRGFRFRARCDFMPPQLDSGQTYADIGLNLEHYLEGMHQKVYEVLDQATLTVAHAEQLYNVRRRTSPGQMFRDQDKGYRYMTAEYITVLGPTT